MGANSEQGNCAMEACRVDVCSRCVARLGSLDCRIVHGACSAPDCRKAALYTRSARVATENALWSRAKEVEELKEENEKLVRQNTQNAEKASKIGANCKRL